MPESLKHAFELRMRDGVAQGKTLTHGKIVLHSEMWASSLNTHKGVSSENGKNRTLSRIQLV